MDKKISLQWSSFPANLLNTMELLWAEESFCDVTLYCRGQEFKCHKVVLSACSVALKSLLLQNTTCQHPVIIMQDMDLQDLEAILQFIYKGQVEIEQDRLKSLLKAAASLQVRGLASMASQEIDIDSKIQQQKSAEEPPPKRTKRQTPKVVTQNGTLDTSGIEKSCHNTTAFDHDVSGAQGYTLEDIADVSFKEEPLSDEEASKVDIFLNESEKDPIGSLNNGDVGRDEDNPSDPLRQDPDVSPPSELAETNAQAFTCKNSNYPPFPCPFCTRAYSSWGFRRRHVKAMHTSSSQLPCKWCGTVLASREVWERHVISKHSLSRPEAEQGLTVLDEAHTVLHGVDSVFIGVNEGHPRRSDQ